jgi:NADP-reducing hydrogenase subunit HndB
MAKLTIDDLKKIKEKTAKSTSLRDGKATVKVTVHMGTCGIAAGAREVMNALMEEMCSSEPNVTVETQDAEPIVYQHMDPNRMRQVFKRHVLLGEVQTDFALAKM